MTDRRSIPLATLKSRGSQRVGGDALHRGVFDIRLAFGLRREQAGLKWFAFALTMSALGSLIGLGIVTRVRSKVAESALLTGSLLATGLGSALAALHPTLAVQVSLAGWLGACAAVAQPSFDAITQVPRPHRRPRANVRALRRAPATALGHRSLDTGGHLAALQDGRRAARDPDVGRGPRLRDRSTIQPSMI